MRRLVFVLWLLAPAAMAQGDGVEPFDAGMAALEAGDAAEAARLLAEAVSENPRDAEAHYGLALAHGARRPPDERQVVRHLDAALRLDPDNARYLEARLEALRRVLPEEKAFSLSDTRRPALARRILALDPASGAAHEELALRAFIEFSWRRSLAQRAGGWDPEATRGHSGAANRARAQAEGHLASALRADPASERAHRLHLRHHAFARDDERFADAAEAYAAARPGDPGAAFYRGLAAYRLHDVEEAERHFAAALAALPAEERAAVESLERFVDAEALAADSAAATERFWRTRDPRLLSPQNERRLEHYARLALADLLFADARSERRGWETPRGEVVVRYGLPDADGRWLASNVIARDFGAYERWAYAPADGDDGLSILFEDPFRNGDFDFPSSSAGEDEATRVERLFRGRPERFVYRPPALVDFPSLVATFKGAGGRTDLVVSMGIPLDEATPRGAVLGLESGAFLLGEGAEVVSEARQPVKRLAPAAFLRTGDGLYWTGGIAVAASPGAYTLAVEFEQERTGAVGIHREPVTLPDYAAPGLRLSSLLPALLVEETEGPVGAGALRRGPFVIRPAPFGRFAAGEPVYLYVEAYGLALRGGSTRYSVEAVLRPEDDANALERAARFLLGRRPPAGVSVRFDGAGAAPDEGQYLILDTAGLAPGAYRLTLRLTDRHTGAAAESARPLSLY
jgi:GWxTD domain-containing protein